VIAELLCDPPGTARAAERSDGRADGLPDLSRADLIPALQPRHEDGVSPESTDAEASHNRSRLRQRWRAGAVGDHRFCRRTTGCPLVSRVSMRWSAARFPVEQLLAVDVGVLVVDGMHI